MKEAITKEDIEKLKKYSGTLKAGDTILASLKIGIARYNSGEVETFKTIVKENSNTECKIINLPGITPIIGEGIKGEAIIEAFKGDQGTSRRRKHFSLKRNFFQTINTIISTANTYRLNLFNNIYSSDEFGRVYIVLDDKRHYLNKERTHFITEDGVFGKITFYMDGNVSTTYINSKIAVSHPNFTSFSYLYISPEDARKGTKLINRKKDQMFNEFMGDAFLPTEELDFEFSEEGKFEPNNSGRIIDLDEYRRGTEEGPKR